MEADWTWVGRLLMVVVPLVVFALLLLAFALCRGAGAIERHVEKGEGP